MMKRTGAVNCGPIFTMVSDRRLGSVDSSQAVFERLKDDAQADPEWFQVIYLDPKNQIIFQGLESFGTTDSASIHPREIAKRAILVGASALICVHNHPSGDPEPSLCDREVTRDIVFAMSTLQIKVLDHIVIGAKINDQQRYYSFADQGLIDDYDLMFRGMPR